jgi:hypothetical protein
MKSEQYTPPEVWELGSLTSLTLGSTHNGTFGYTKNNDTTADKFTGPPFNTGDRGSGCTIGGVISCQ